MSVYSVVKSCLTLCDPMDCSLSGSSVHGISQVRILEWVTISFSRETSWPRVRTCTSCIGRWILYRLSHQEAPRVGKATSKSVGLGEGQVEAAVWWGYWSPIFPGKNTGVGCHFLLQGIFPTQGWNLCLLHWQVDSLPLSHLGIPKCHMTSLVCGI